MTGPEREVGERVDLGGGLTVRAEAAGQAADALHQRARVVTLIAGIQPIDPHLLGLANAVTVAGIDRGLSPVAVADAAGVNRRDITRLRLQSPRLDPQAAAKLASWAGWSDEPPSAGAQA